MKEELKTRYDILKKIQIKFEELQQTTTLWIENEIMIKIYHVETTAILIHQEDVEMKKKIYQKQYKTNVSVNTFSWFSISTARIVFEPDFWIYCTVIFVKIQYF